MVLVWNIGAIVMIQTHYGGALPLGLLDLESSVASDAEVGLVALEGMPAGSLVGSSPGGSASSWITCWESWALQMEHAAKFGSPLDG